MPELPHPRMPRLRWIAGMVNMSDQKTPPDSRTVNPGQAVTYHQTDTTGIPRDGDRLIKRRAAAPLGERIRAVLDRHGISSSDPAWRGRLDAALVDAALGDQSPGHDHYVTDSPQPVKVAKPPPAGTEAWRRTAIRSVLIEHGIAQPPQVGEAELDRLVDGLIMRLDRPEENDAERRIVGIEYQVSELRTDRDANSKALVNLTEFYNQLANRVEEMRGTVRALADTLVSVQDRARAQDDRINALGRQPVPTADSLTRVRALEAWKARLPGALGVPDDMHLIEAAVNRAARPRQDTRIDAELHRDMAHPDFEYETTETPRKCGYSKKPYGDGWEPNPHVTGDGRNWQRFDNTEEEYWMRRKPSASAATQDPTPEDIDAMVAAQHRAWDAAVRPLVEALEWPGRWRQDFQRVLLGILKENAKELREIIGLPRRQDVTMWSAENRPMQPGDVWAGRDGTEYVAVRASEVGDRPRWWVGLSTAHWPEVPGDLHLGENKGGWPVALVVRESDGSEPDRTPVCSSCGHPAGNNGMLTVDAGVRQVGWCGKDVCRDRIWRGQDRPLQPGDIWRDPEGTEYVVIPADNVGDRLRWTFEAGARARDIALETKRDMARGVSLTGLLALVLRNPEHKP